MRSHRHHTAGFTLIEMGIVLGIASVIAAMAIPSMIRWVDSQRLSQSVRVVDGAFSFARSEAIRTGNVHIVFVQQDAEGNALVDAGGDALQLMVIDDGRVGTAGQNCKIDAGESVLELRLENGVDFGAGSATGPVPSDPGAGAIASGSTFEDAGGNPARWVQFQPEGPPRAFSADCTNAGIGSGGGGLYLTNGNRSVAVVVTPLGGTRIHRWEAGAGAWTS